MKKRITSDEWHMLLGLDQGNGVNGRDSSHQPSIEEEAREEYSAFQIDPDTKKQNWHQILAKQERLKKVQKPERKLIPKFTLSFAVVMVTLVSGILFLIINSNESRLSSKYKLQVSGAYLLNSKKMLDKRPVEQGDIIETREGNEALIQSDDNLQIKIHGNSRLQYKFVDGRIVMHLFKGDMHTTVKPNFLEKPMLVRTSRLNVLVRGTIFHFHEKEDTKSSYFCLCRGKVDVEYAKQKKSMASKNHKAFELQEKDGKLIRKPQKRMYH